MTLALVSNDPTISSTASFLTDHTVALPAPLLEGDWLLFITAQSNAGRNEIIWDDQTIRTFHGDATISSDTVSIAYAYVTAAIAAAATLDFTTTSIDQTITFVYHLRGGNLEWTTPRLAHFETVSTTTPNPPSLTPGYGAVEYLWIAGIYAGIDTTVTTAPATFTNLAEEGLSHIGLGAAIKTATAASEDPANFTLASARVCGAFTIGIPTAEPAPPAGSFPLPERRIMAGGNAASLVFELPADLTGKGTILLCGSNARTFATPAGWTLLGTHSEGTNVQFSAFYRMGGGGDITVLASASDFLSGIAYVFDDVDFATAPPTVEFTAVTPANATVDPPSEAFTAGDYVVITGDTHDDQGFWLTQPTNYLNMIGSNTENAGLTGNACLDSAFRFVTGTSEDPGSYTIMVTQRQVTYTIAVPGVAASPPDAPTNPAASALSASSVRVTWDDVADETGYRVERSPDGVGSWADVSGSLDPDATSYDDTGLSAETEYFYRVIAFNVGGDSDPSSVVSATTQSASSGGGNRIGGTGAIRRSPTTHRAAR